jgi:type II secretory pathway pseudopilin PulG
MKFKSFEASQNGGFTLLEVVLAIAVFAFGMLALVELQTGLARSSSDANTRTVAANVAEELVEVARGFTQIAADPDNLRMDYDEISTYGAVATVQRAGYDYSVNVIVEDHYWDADSESFTTAPPVGIVNSDFKTMDIVVMWRGLEGGETFADHDTIDFGRGGGVRIVEAVPSSPSLLGALVAADKEATGTPPVTYNPGDNPDIVQLTLDADGGKFKEATSVAPQIFRDDKVETWFDVVTYSQLPNADAVFLRREEFTAITCECELETSPAEADYGLKPTLWNGVTYTEGEKVSKPIGTVPNGVQQSGFCTVCCRDHHDGSGDGAEDVYNLADIGSDSDHGHYARGNDGVIITTPVGDGDTYLEACRLVRKDGFMRVTQDANQGALIGFPEGYFDFDEGVTAYSEYVVDAVSEYYTANSPISLPQPNPPDSSSLHVFPARTTLDGTDLPTATFGRSQQLRSRAVYTDHLTAAAQAVIAACFPLDSRTEDCEAPNATTELEIYPFFDIQMTWLARWNATLNNVVVISNEPIESGNTHSRGVVELVGDADGQSEVTIISHTGNLGLTATGAIDPDYNNDVKTDTLFVDANGSSEPVPPIGNVVSGTLSSTVRRVPAADLLLVAEGALCGQTDTEWACVVTGEAQLTISNYYLNNPRVYVCSDLQFVSETTGASIDANTTTFVLPNGGEDLNIWATTEACDR